MKIIDYDDTSRFLTTSELRVSAEHNLTDARTKHQLYWSAAKIEQSEAQVDRLAQALANMDLHVRVQQGISAATWTAVCDPCGKTSVEVERYGSLTRDEALEAIEHAPDCVYVWAIEHVAALEDK